MFGKKDIPVYLFSGFLESGKSTCIQEVIEEGNFSDGKKTLLILCEEGEHEIDEQMLVNNLISCVVIEDEEELTEKQCLALEKKYKPDRICIEYNGMWDGEKLVNEIIPAHWYVVQTFVTVNAQTYEMYNNNMKPILIGHYKQADLVIFNRCPREGMDKAAARRSVKAVNRMAQVIFELEDGTVDNDIKDELPYDVDQDIIKLEDDDYGLWYLDASENPERYKGKVIIHKGKVYKGKKFPSNAFVPTREAMTCCVDDIAPIGFVCYYADAPKLKQDSWVTVKGKVKVEHNPQGQPYIAMDILDVQPAEEPEEKIVYFT
ncbi:GTP-binding protein [Eubacterium xylanophilum]|uniref:TIGR03943 family putative permease subunit n=1 Tax=Eubacterium xylanophilum TaxID=39497 RepID=UPI00047B9672|nr:GTP-binding protein [Eubacterium xylanophilum]